MDEWFLPRAAILVCLTGCIDPGSNPIEVPADVDFVALLTVGDGGEVLGGSALRPVDEGIPILAAADTTVRIVGYGEDARATSQPLRVVEGCEATVGTPRWYANWSPESLEALDPSSAPQLTTAEPIEDCVATCRRFETQTFVIDGSAERGLVNFGLRVDEDTVVLGVYDRDAYIVSRDGTVTSTVIAVDGPIIAAFNGPAGELWFVSDDGTITTGTLDDLRVRTRGGLPPQRGFRGSMVIDDPLVPNDLVGVTGDGLLVRYDGASWRTISEVGTAMERFEIGVARVGARESFLLGPSATLLHETPQGLVPAPLGAGGASVPLVLANVPGFGVIVSTDFARVYRWQDAWIELEEPPIFGIPRVVVPLQGAFLVGGTAGVLTEYRFEGGYCEPLALAPHRVQLVTHDRFGIVLYGGGSDQDFGVTFADVAPN